MGIDKHRRLAWSIHPLAIDCWLSTAILRRQALAVLKTHRIKTCFDELSGVFHALCHGRIGTNGRERHQCFQRCNQCWFACKRMVKDRITHGVSSQVMPPSTLRICPVIHPASPDVRKAAAAAISSGAPSLRVWMRFISCACPSGPKASH